MCDKCWLQKTRIIGIGIPTHFRPTSKNVSACGVEHPERAEYDGRSTDCILCQRTKAWKRYMGSNAEAHRSAPTETLKAPKP